MTLESDRYDAIILGSGLAGTVLAAILARAGRSVLLLEKGQHPRMAIGESMLPQSAMWMWILGQRYDIPELLTLCDTKAIARSVSRTCGQKKVIGFVYHREGELHDPARAHQLIPPSVPFFSESHLYRQDVDLFMLEAARRHGATYRDRVEVVDFERDDDGVWVETADGTRYTGRVLIDGAGRRSPVAARLEMREAPTRLRTRSRSIFNHFAGMRPFDETITREEHPGLSRRWHDGTLHHVFDGGWFWIIPFGNHAGSDNGITSIGLTLDTSKHPPRDDLSAEEEFWSLVRRFPAVHRHLEGITPTQRWIRTGRLQYSSARAVDDRVILLAHAYGFSDPLYSQGLVSTFELIHALADRLLTAFDDGDLSRARFEDLNTLQRAQLDANDQMVSCSYRAMAAFPLWNAWVQLWLASVLFGDTWIFRSCLHYLDSDDKATFDALRGPRRPLAMAPFAEALQLLIDRGEEALGRFESGELSAEDAAEVILSGLRSSEWLPKSVYRWGAEDERHLDLVPEHLGAYLSWGQSAEAPRWLRERLFDFKIPAGM